MAATTTLETVGVVCGEPFPSSAAQFCSNSCKGNRRHMHDPETADQWRREWGAGWRER